MKTPGQFSISPGWRLWLGDMNLDPAELLSHAGLPGDLFNRPDSKLNTKQYFSLWRSADIVAGDRDVPLLFAEHMSVEGFDPALFACICSENLAQAVHRISEFKPLICPLRLLIDETEKYFELEIRCEDKSEELPPSLALTELVFFTQLARIATRTRVQPIGVTCPFEVKSKQKYKEYFGCAPVKRNSLSIRFSIKDTQLQFLTANAGIWNFFEEGLRQQLKDLDSEASTSDRVRAVLIKQLPTGDIAIDNIANLLAMSKRNLQRKLSAESSSYQTVLQQVRRDLAEYYLQNTAMQLGEISFMLGFGDQGSFTRAFGEWTGASPGQFRSVAAASDR